MDQSEKQKTLLENNNNNFQSVASYQKETDQNYNQQQNQQLQQQNFQNIVNQKLSFDEEYQKLQSEQLLNQQQQQQSNLQQQNKLQSINNDSEEDEMVKQAKLLEEKLNTLQRGGNLIKKKPINSQKYFDSQDFFANKNQDVEKNDQQKEIFNFQDDEIYDEQKKQQSQQLLLNNNNFDTANYDIKSQIKLKLRGHKNVVCLHQEQSTKLPVLINIKAKDKNIENLEQMLQSNRPFIDLILILDTSGSMQGEKLNLAKESVKYILSLMQENDRVCLIEFNTQAQRIFPLQTCSQVNLEQFQQKIDSLISQGSTETYEGMKIGLEVLKQRRNKNNVASIFVLSDGQDNSKSTLIQSIKKLQLNLQIQEQFNINSFGYGNDHDAEKMKEIASLKGGNFYYIKETNFLKKVFASAIAGLFSVVGQNLNLTATLLEQQFEQNSIFKNLKFSKIFGQNEAGNEQSQQSVLDDDNKSCYQQKYNFLLAGTSQDILLELEFPKIDVSKFNQKEHQNKTVLKVDLELQSMNHNQQNSKIQKQEQTDNQQQNKQLEEEKQNNQQQIFDIVNFSQELKISFTIDPVEECKHTPNTKVLVQMLRFEGMEILKEAQNLGNSEKYAEAKNILEQMMLKIKNSDLMNNPALKMLYNDLELAQTMCEPKKFKTVGKKFLVYRNEAHRCKYDSADYFKEYQQENQQSQQQQFVNPYANKMQQQLLQNINSQQQQQDEQQQNQNKQ